MKLFLFLLLSTFYANSLIVRNKTDGIITLQIMFEHKPKGSVKKYSRFVGKDIWILEELPRKEYKFIIPKNNILETDKQIRLAYLVDIGYVSQNEDRTVTNDDLEHLQPSPLTVKDGWQDSSSEEENFDLIDSDSSDEEN
jgi:hypothetical protein